MGDLSIHMSVNSRHTHRHDNMHPFDRYARGIEQRQAKARCATSERFMFGAYIPSQYVGTTRTRYLRHRFLTDGRRATLIQYMHSARTRSLFTHSPQPDTRVAAITTVATVILNPFIVASECSGGWVK